MAKLNQIIAVANGKKTQTEGKLTEVYHKLQKAELLSGITKTYRPKDEDGDKLPSESKNLQFKVKEAIQTAVESMSDTMDVLATQEYGNTLAKANVVVDGKPILVGVPVSYLLYLEKQLIHINTLVEKIPVLDPAENWSYNSSVDAYATEPAETTRTKKVPAVQVLYPATDKHPAQVAQYNEDVLVGFWKTIKFSGAIPQKEKNDLIVLVRKMQEAIKVAREEANSIEVKNQEVGKPLFTFLFGKYLT